MNFGSSFLSGHRPDHNAYLVRRLREAGFVIVGTTNMPEFGILPTTEPRHSGPTHNPWDLDRTPGGSSGGSAAAVAAGMLPVAHGNDGGGSLRIPAACCGLVGLKPSRGRVSRGPDLGESFLSADGVLTRTVSETAALLDVLAGYEVGDATWAPRPVEPYVTSVRRDPGRLRVAMTAANVLDVDVDPECVRGMHAAGELLASLGHEVETASPALPGGDPIDLFIEAFGPQVSLGIMYGQLLAGRAPNDDEIEPLSRAIFERAQKLPSVAYLGAVAQLQAVARGLVAFFAEYDLLLTPALGERPLPIGEIHGCGEDPMADLKRSARFTPFTSLWNVTGQPAISIPLGFGDDGLPTAAQLVGQAAGRGHAAPGGGPDGGGRRPPPADPAAVLERAQHVGHPPRADAEPLGVGCAVGREHRHGQQLRLVPGGEGGGPGEGLVCAQQRPREREREGTSGAAGGRCGG